MAIISELINSTLSDDLFGLLAQPGIVLTSGVLLTATEVAGLLSCLNEIKEADPSFILKSLVDVVAAASPDLPILVARVSDTGDLQTYGWKLQQSEGVPTLFGAPISKDLNLQIKYEKCGAKEKEFDRPVCRLTYSFVNAKGKKQSTDLDFPIASTEKALKISYGEWASRCTGGDEEDLIKAELIAPYAIPKLGTGGGGGGFVNLTEFASQGAISLKITASKFLDHKTKIEAKSGNPVPTIAFECEDSEGTPILFWPEISYNLTKPVGRGGDGWGPAFGAMVDRGVAIYMHIYGVKVQMRWDSSLKADAPVLDDAGNPRLTYDLVFSQDSAAPSRVKRSTVAIASSVPAPELKSAAVEVEEQCSFGDIPF